MKRSVISILVAISILALSCNKEPEYVRVIGDKSDVKTIMFNGKECPVYVVKITETGEGIAINKVNGEEMKIHVTIPTDGTPVTITNQTKNPIVWGCSCWCECCGSRWSTLLSGMPSGDCVYQCPNQFGGCTGKIQHPFYQFPCNCGGCNLFVIPQEE